MSVANVTYENHLSTTEARWFAIYTGFRKEKYVQEELRKKGVETYVPIMTHTRQYVRKVKTVELPLISCYVFVKITKQKYVPVLETEYVHRFVKFSKNLISIPEKEMELMRLIVGEKLAVRAEPMRWEQGERVQIMGGTLTGLRGKLVRRNNKKEFIIELENVGHAFQLSVAPHLLKKIDL